VLLEAPLRFSLGQAARCIGTQRGNHRFGEFTVRRDREVRREDRLVANLGMFEV
jgi:hypothetical protein